jgi:hypothetical protein
MTLDKTHFIVFVVGAVLGLLSGFFSGKAIYDKPMIEKVTRDTVTLYDTIPQYYPKPVEVEHLKTEYKWLTKVVTENVDSAKNSANSASFSAKDSVLVEVPIESKHYHASDYDAWVSGYEPSLDSIFVYRKTEYITETIERTIKPKRKPWGIGFHAGYGYDFKSKTAAPFIGVGISYDIISF